MNASEIRLKIKESHADEKAEVQRVLSEIGNKYDCERKHCMLSGQKYSKIATTLMLNLNGFRKVITMRNLSTLV